MELGKVAPLIEGIERKVGLPAGLLTALVLTENGSAQHSELAFAAAPLDPFARRYEPGFYRHYIRGTSWEQEPWGDVPEVIASSYGLCQVMLTTAIWAKRKGLLRPWPSAAGGVPVDPAALPDAWDGEPWSLFEPIVNLRVGAEVLRYKARRFGSWKAGIAAYNAGSPRRMDDGLFVNQRYVDKVLRFATDEEGWRDPPPLTA